MGEIIACAFRVDLRHKISQVNVASNRAYANDQHNDGIDKSGHESRAVPFLALEETHSRKRLQSKHRI